MYQISIPSLSDSMAQGIRNKIGLLYVKTTCSLFFRLKDDIPPSDKSNIVYGIPCLDCQKCYIGQTKQQLKNRTRQNEYDYDDTFRDKTGLTALATHWFQ